MHSDIRSSTPKKTDRKFRLTRSDVFVFFAVVCWFGPLSFALIDAYEVKAYQVLSGLLVPFVLLVMFAIFRYPGWLRL